jgi:hypothetical protein
VTLHSYRYASAERAKVVGMPERFAQAALGHSKAIRGIVSDSIGGSRQEAGQNYFNRKKSCRFVAGNVSWKNVFVTVGVPDTDTQLVVIRSVFCCRLAPSC